MQPTVNKTSRAIVYSSVIKKNYLKVTCIKCEESRLNR